MQLIIYMNAMMELYEKKTGKRVYPAGMFYFHLDDPIVNVEHENEAEDKILKDLKMSGVVNEDFQLIDHMEHTGSEGYLTLPVRATKNGYDKRSSVLNTTQLFNLGRIVEKKMTELGVQTIVYTDIATDGTLQGPNTAAMREMTASVNADIIASGGVGNIEHIQSLVPAGVDGVIVGRALYTGSVDLKEAIREIGEIK